MKHGHWLILLTILFVLTACGSSAARQNNRGNRNYEAEDYDAAMQNYSDAQQENPDLAEPYYNAGNTRHRQDDLPKSVAQLQQSLRTADDELAPKAYYNLGNTYFRAQDWPLAIDAYKQALLLDPNDMDAKHNLELALQQQQQQQQQSQQPQQPQQNQGNQPQDNQNQQGQGQEQQPDQENDDQNNDQEQSEGGGEGQQPDQQDQSGGSGQQDQQQSGGAGGLSRAEAEQLLDALGQDSQTLQQRLQQRYGSTTSPPVQDW